MVDEPVNTMPPFAGGDSRSFASNAAISFSHRAWPAGCVAPAAGAVVCAVRVGTERATAPSSNASNGTNGERRRIGFTSDLLAGSAGEVFVRRPSDQMLSANGL